MTTVAQAILAKLDAIEERVKRIEENQDASFLQQEVEEVKKTATVTVPRKRSSHKTHLPPQLSRKIMEDSELKASTRKSYETTLMRLLDNSHIVPVLVEQRNLGKPYAKISRSSVKLMGQHYTEKVLASMLSVGLRYGVIERTADNKYRVGAI